MLVNLIGNALPLVDFVGQEAFLDISKRKRKKKKKKRNCLKFFIFSKKERSAWETMLP